MTRAFFWLERLIPALRYIQSLISWNSRSVIAATPVPATEGRWDGMESGRIEFARPEPDRMCGCSSIGNQTVAQGATRILCQTFIISLLVALHRTQRRGWNPRRNRC